MEKNCYYLHRSKLLSLISGYNFLAKAIYLILFVVIYSFREGGCKRRIRWKKSEEGERRKSYKYKEL